MKTLKVVLATIGLTLGVAGGAFMVWSEFRNHHWYHDPRPSADAKKEAEAPPVPEKSKIDAETEIREVKEAIGTRPDGEVLAQLREIEQAAPENIQCRVLLIECLGRMAQKDKSLSDGPSVRYTTSSRNPQELMMYDEMMALGRLGKDGEGAVLELMRSKPAAVHIIGIRAAGDLHLADAVDELAAAARDTNDWNTIIAICTTLARMKSPKASAALNEIRTNMVDVRLADQRNHASVLYVESLTPSERLELAQTTKDEDLLAAMASIDGPRLETEADALAAIALREDLAARHRSKALTRLVKAKDFSRTKHVPVLVQLSDMNKYHKHFAFQAASGLAQLSPEDGVAPLLPFLKLDQEMARRALDQLASMKCTEAVLIKLLEDKSDPAKSDEWVPRRWDVYLAITKTQCDQETLLRLIHLMIATAPPMSDEAKNRARSRLISGSADYPGPEGLITNCISAPKAKWLIQQLMHDKLPAARVVAAQALYPALKRLTPAEATSIATELFNDDSPQVKAAAALSLLRIRQLNRPVPNDLLMMKIAAVEDHFVANAVRDVLTVDDGATEAWLALLGNRAAVDTLSNSIRFFGAHHDPRFVPLGAKWIASPDLAARLPGQWNPARNLMMVMVKCCDDIKPTALDLMNKLVMEQDGSIRSNICSSLLGLPTLTLEELVKEADPKVIEAMMQTNIEWPETIRSAIAARHDIPEQTRQRMRQRINTTQSARQRPKAFGSGFIVSADGYVLTNNHVVANANKIGVKVGKVTYPGTLVSSDVEADLALLKIQAQDLAHATFPQEAEYVQMGQSVFAVGFPIPLEGAEPKVTKGVISCLDGFWDAPRMFQMDVTVQPGISGGPLADESGRVIGIVSEKLSPCGRITESVNYAIKWASIEKFLKPLQVMEKIERAASAQMSFEDAAEKVRKSTVMIIVNDEEQ